MAPGVLLSSSTEYDTRASKRLKATGVGRAQQDENDGGIPSHPLKVKPSGNAYSSSINSKNNAGLFKLLPDELILQILEQFAARKLSLLGSTCRFLYAFTQYDDLWRALFVE
jgi:hypothetical protein